MLRFAAILIATQLASTGCYFVRHKTVPVQVIDGETGQPVANARATIGTSGPIWPKFPIKRAKSDSRGMLSIGRPNPKDVWGSTSMWLEAAGYPDTRVPAPPYPTTTPALTIARIYHGPMPRVTVIIPAGYRGLIDIRHVPSDGPQGALGQRDFRYVVGADGKLTIPVTDLVTRNYFESSLVNGSIPQLTYVTSEGETLKTISPPIGIAADENRWRVPADQVALRVIPSSPDRARFVNGTLADWQNAKASIAGVETR